MNNKETEIVEILCGVFRDKYSPLSRAEFWKLYHQHGDSLDQLAGSDNEQITSLMERKGVIAFGKEQMDQMGIRIISFTDEGFPKRLLDVLGDFCPPLLYCSGDTSVLNGKFVGYVGSRSIGESDISWTEERVKQNIRDGFSVVTGGAKGVDSVAMTSALNSGGKALVFLPDNIKEKLREPYIRQNIERERLLVYSHVSPFAVKARNSFVAAAMERNKFIYAASSGTVVVRSDLKKGGTWSGAVETLKHKWAPVFAWDNKQYPGNQELIKMGALALTDEGSLVKTERSEESGSSVKENNTDGNSAERTSEPKQMSLYDLMGQGTQV